MPIHNALKILSVAIVVFITSPCLGQETLVVPHGKPILVDGRLGADEWNDAAVVTEGQIKFLIKQDSGFVYAAFVCSDKVSMILDLYLSGSKEYSFHVSAKLAQRQGLDKTSDQWIWWNNDGWVGNTSRVESFQAPPSFLMENIREMQFNKQQWFGKSIALQAILTFLEKNEVVDTVSFPKNGEPMQLKISK